MFCTMSIFSLLPSWALGGFRGGAPLPTISLHISFVGLSIPFWCFNALFMSCADDEDDDDDDDRDDDVPPPSRSDTPLSMSSLSQAPMGGYWSLAEARPRSVGTEGALGSWFVPS